MHRACVCVCARVSACACMRTFEGLQVLCREGLPSSSFAAYREERVGKKKHPPGSGGLVVSGAHWPTAELERAEACAAFFFESTLSKSQPLKLDIFLLTCLGMLL